MSNYYKCPRCPANVDVQEFTFMNGRTTIRAYCHTCMTNVTIEYRTPQPSEVCVMSAQIDAKVVAVLKETPAPRT